MVQKVEIEFTAKMEKYMSDVLSAERSTEAATGKMTEGFGQLKGSILSVASALGLTLGAGAIVSFVKSAVESSARLEVLRNNFKGTAADIELFRKATAGTVTEANLIRLSNQATDLGLTLKQQAILFSMADDAADKYGGSVEENFERVLKASEGGTKGLKDLGIQKAVYDKIVQDFVEGYGVKQLNQLDAETQKWIQVEAMIKATGTTLEDVTNKMQDNLDKIEELGVKWETFKTKSGEVLVPALLGVLDVIIDIDNWALQAGNDIDKLLGLKGFFGPGESSENYVDPKGNADLKQALSNYTWVENGKVVSTSVKPKGKIIKPNKSSNKSRSTYVGYKTAQEVFEANAAGTIRKPIRPDRPEFESFMDLEKIDKEISEGILDEATYKMEAMRDSMSEFGNTARYATNMLASGLARALMYGEDFAGVLKNIGSLLLESGLAFLIQAGLRAGAVALGIPLPFANGGVITEPVMGIGMQSKRSYLFGEAGNEVVIPQRNFSSPSQINITVAGELTARGNDLHALIKRVDKLEKRYS